MGILEHADDILIRKFTIIYKTYKNDLDWFTYSLLSLQKYLYADNIYEIIIYTHDQVYFNIVNILENINMVSFLHYRVIPVFYNYHGYIKQMVVKCNCYKDIQTKYIVILDSAILLKKKLNFETLIRKDGKIEWKYLKIEDDPNNRVFDFWKNACEDSTKKPKKIHYMSNGFPFIFTKTSLESAANHFIEMHNCDYDTYCYNRCKHANINIEDSINIFDDKLSKVFTEFEYLGYYCHNFSKDYIFTSTSFCHMDSQFQIYNSESYFIQYWSHGGINNSGLNQINTILCNKTVILVWTQKVNNLGEEHFWGLGDILRGTMSMFQYSKKYNFCLIVDIQLHPISKFLKVNTHEYSDFVLENKDNIPFVFEDKIEEYLINNDNVVYLFTNSFLIEGVTQECKDFMKTILTPTDEFEKYMQKIYTQFSIPVNYNIIHFRLGDNYLIHNNNCDFQKCINIMNSNIEQNDILISDSFKFKEEIIHRNYKVNLFMIPITHLGYYKHNDIRDTIFEFFLITKSSKIKTYTCYSHISGFVNMASIIYDIPLRSI
jgi:hypothetical protein